MKLLLDLGRRPKLPAGASAPRPAESSKICWTWCPWVTALLAQGRSQFGWAGDEERAYAILKAWMGFYMLKPHSFLTVLHSLLSLRFTPGAHQALSTWMQVHSSTEKLPKFTKEGYCSGAKVL